LKQGVTPPYKPLPAERLYLGEGEWKERLGTGALVRLTPFAVPEASAFDIGARQGHNFAAERAEPNANVFEALAAHVLALQAAGKRVTIALWSEGARERMSHVLADHKLHNLTPVADWSQALAMPRSTVALGVLGIESGFETDDVAIVSEQDILGDRLVRPRRGGPSGGPARPRHERIISSPKPPVSLPAIWWSMWTTVLAVSRDYSQSRRLARPMTALKFTTPKAPSSICRSRTWIFCRATAPRRRRSISIVLVAAT